MIPSGVHCLNLCITIGTHLILVKATQPRINQWQSLFSWVKVWEYNNDSHNVPSLSSSLCLHVLVYSHRGLWSVWRWLRCYRLRYSVRWDRTRFESIIHRCHGLVHKTSHCTLVGILVPSCVHLLQLLLYVIIVKVML